MASQVLSGASNASYTNNTGQNVRLIINYMSNVTEMRWNLNLPNVSLSPDAFAVITSSTGITVGKNVPISYTSTNVTTGSPLTLTPITNSTFPVELMLPNNFTFTSICGAYNIIVIKEDGT
jgi:hypothetical protein